MGQPGAVICSPCPGGQFQPINGLGYCNTCAPGYYAMPGNAKCNQCGPGSYATPGSLLCSSCPPGSVGKISCTCIFCYL